MKYCILHIMGWLSKFVLAVTSYLFFNPALKRLQESTTLKVVFCFHLHLLLLMQKQKESHTNKKKQDQYPVLNDAPI